MRAIVVCVDIMVVPVRGMSHALESAAAIVPCRAPAAGRRPPGLPHPSPPACGCSGP